MKEETKLLFTLENIHDYDGWMLGNMANELIDEIQHKHVRWRHFVAEYRNRSNQIHHYITTVINNRRNQLKKEEAEMGEKSVKDEDPKKVEEEVKETKVEAKDKDTASIETNLSGRKRLYTEAEKLADFAAPLLKPVKPVEEPHEIYHVKKSDNLVEPITGVDES